MSTAVAKADRASGGRERDRGRGAGGGAAASPRRGNPRSLGRARDEFRALVTEQFEAIRMETIERGEAATWTSIYPKILRIHGADSWTDLDIGPFHSIPEIKEFTERCNWIYAYTMAFAQSHAIATLKDLDAELCSCEGASSFASYRVGPLLKQPAVKSYFAPPPEITEIPNVTFHRFMEGFYDVVRRQRGRITDLNAIVAQTIQGVATYLKFAKPEDMCIRIGGNLGLLHKVRARAEKNYNDLVANVTKESEKRENANIRACIDAEIKKQIEDSDPASDRAKWSEGCITSMDVLRERHGNRPQLPMLKDIAKAKSLGKAKERDAPPEQQIVLTLRNDAALSQQALAGYLLFGDPSVCAPLAMTAAVREAVQRCDADVARENMPVAAAAQRLLDALKEASSTLSMEAYTYAYDDVAALRQLATLRRAYAGQPFATVVRALRDMSNDSFLLLIRVFAVKLGWLATPDDLLQALRSRLEQHEGDVTISNLLEMEQSLSASFGCSVDRLCGGASFVSWALSQPDVLARFALAGEPAESSPQITPTKKAAVKVPPTKERVSNAILGAVAPARVQASASVITFLVKLEQLVVGQMHVLNFTDLGFGSFCEFINNNSLAPLVGLGNMQLVGLPEVREFARQWRDFNGADQEEALVRQLTAHLDISDLEKVALETSVLSVAPSANDVLNGVVLESALGDAPPSEHLYPPQMDNLIQRVRRVPYLEDLERALHWEETHRVRGAGPLWPRLRDARAKYPDLRVEIVGPQRQPRAIYLLPPESECTPTAYMSALGRGDSRQSAAILCGALCQPSPPSKLLMAHTRTHLHDRVSALGAPGICQLLLGMLALVPAGRLRVRVARDVLLPALDSSALIPDARDALLYVARDQPAWRGALHSLAVDLGVPSWLADFNDPSVLLLSGAGYAVQVAGSTAASSVEATQPTAVAVEVPVTVVTQGSSEHSASPAVTVAPTMVPGTRPVEQVVPGGEVDQEEARAFGIVSSIRQEFALDIEIEPAAAAAVASMRQIVANSVKQLSVNLYDSDVHFVLELLQNADDNSYREGDIPNLVFNLAATCLTVHNNEVGFSEANVRSLCRVGESTKVNKIGYIGQKGIGFKSVFRVTDCPEIHSRGFHIRFDHRQSDMGYITPTWVPATERPPAQLAATTIVLPLQPEKAHTERLTARLQEIDATLLLFLQKMGCIQLDFDEATVMPVSPFATTPRPAIKSRVMERRHEADGTVLLTQSDEMYVRPAFTPNGEKRVEAGAMATTTTSNQQRWLVVRQRVSPPAHLKRLETALKETEIGMAFPLEDATGTDQELPRAALETRQAFAFLPIRDFGLRFIVQADFILPSSRQDVDLDAPWNQWLASQLPALFLSARDKYVAVVQGRHPEVTVGRACTSFLRFVPLEREVTGFFAGLSHGIHAALRETPSILSAQGEWVLPRHLCVLDASGGPHAAQTSALLAKHMHVHLLAPTLTLTDELMRILQVQRLTAGLLHSLLDSICRGATTTRDEAGAVLSINNAELTEAGVDWLVWLLGRIAARFSEGDDAESVLRGLGELPFLPLRGGGYGRPGDRTLFMPPTSESETKKEESPRKTAQQKGKEEKSPAKKNAKAGKASPDKVKELQAPAANVLWLYSTRVKLVANSLLARARALGCYDCIYRLLKMLLMNEFGEHDALRCIARAAEDKDTYLANRAAVETDSVFAFNHWRTCDGCKNREDPAWRAYAEHAAVVCADDAPRRVKDGVHFDKQHYYCGNNLAFALNRVQPGLWPTVSRRYTDLGRIAELRPFFTLLGVTDFLFVVEKQKRFADQENSPWSRMQPFQWMSRNWKAGATPNSTLTRITDELDCADYVSPELENIFNTLIEKEKEIGFHGAVAEAALEFQKTVDFEWDKYRVYAEASVRRFNTVMVEFYNHVTVESEFANRLRAWSWVPTSKGKLESASNVYVTDDHIRSLLGSHASYLLHPIQNEDLSRRLSIRIKVPWKILLELVLAWSKTPDFVASVDCMSRVYQVLLGGLDQHDAMPFDQFVKLYGDHPLFFVPTTRGEGRTEVAGKFYARQDVCWLDPSHALGESCPALSDHYANERVTHRSNRFQQAALPFDDEGAESNSTLRSLRLFINVLPPAPVYVNFILELTRGTPISQCFNNDTILRVRSVLAMWQRTLARAGARADANTSQGHQDVQAAIDQLKRDDARVLPTLEGRLVARSKCFSLLPHEVDSALVRQLRMNDCHLVPVKMDQNDEGLGHLLGVLEVRAVSQIPFTIVRNDLKRDKEMHAQLCKLLPCVFCHLKANEVPADPMIQEWISRLVVIRASKLELDYLVNDMHISVIVPYDFTPFDPTVTSLALYACSIDDMWTAIRVKFLPAVDSDRWNDLLELVRAVEDPWVAAQKKLATSNRPLESVWRVVEAPSAEVYQALEVVVEPELKSSSSAGASANGEASASDEEVAGGADGASTSSSIEADGFSLLGNSEEITNRNAAAWNMSQRKKDPTTPPTAPLPIFPANAAIPYSGRNPDAPQRPHVGEAPRFDPAPRPGSGGGGRHDAAPPSDDTEHFPRLPGENGHLGPNSGHREGDGHRNDEGRANAGEALSLLSHLNGNNDQARGFVAYGRSTVDVTEHLIEDEGFVSQQLPAALEGLASGGAQLSEEDALRVGRWGEEAVFRYLSASGEYASVVWMNKDGETRLPYDIKATPKGEDKMPHLIEVKASQSTGKHHCEISVNEIETALQHRARYHIARVYAAGSPAARLAWVNDPVKYMSNGVVRLVLILPALVK